MGCDREKWWFNKGLIWFNMVQYGFLIWDIGDSLHMESAHLSMITSGIRPSMAIFGCANDD